MFIYLANLFLPLKFMFMFNLNNTKTENIKKIKINYPGMSTTKSFAAHTTRKTNRIFVFVEKWDWILENVLSFLYYFAIRIFKEFIEIPLLLVYIFMSNNFSKNVMKSIKEFICFRIVSTSYV